MSDGDRPENYRLTPKGRALANDIVRRFAAGQTIVQIANAIGIAPAGVQIIMAVDAITPEGGEIAS